MKSLLIASMASMASMLLATAPGQLAQAAGEQQAVASTPSPVEPTVELRIRRRFAAAGPVTVVVRIEPNLDNRMVRLTLDSGAFFRASDIQIDGDRAPRSHFVTWKALPPGDYCVEATLTGASGSVHTDRRQYSAIGVNGFSMANGRPRGPCFAQRSLAGTLLSSTTQAGAPQPLWKVP